MKYKSQKVAYWFWTMHAPTNLTNCIWFYNGLCSELVLMDYMILFHLIQLELFILIYWLFGY